jgi:hypothetical protein
VYRSKSIRHNSKKLLFGNGLIKQAWIQAMHRENRPFWGGGDNLHLADTEMQLMPLPNIVPLTRKSLCFQLF